ncbi:MAG: heme biosynthesis protein HemY [Betaproteobacteria bacterium]|nr:heme biosynthesis protein HemY [Betaproteobacteria bacterium]
MRAVLWILALFALATGVALLARVNDGYVLVTLPPWRVEASLNFVIVALMLGFALLYLAVRALGGLLRMPRVVRGLRQGWMSKRARRSLRDAMRLFYEGRYAQAISQAERAYDRGEAPGLAALVAVRAAHALHDDERERDWLKRASAHDDETRTARLFTEAELHLDARRFTEALDCLKQLQRGGSRQIVALRLALRARQGAGDWQEVVRLAWQLQRHNALTPDQAASLRRRAHLEIVRQLAPDPAALMQYWNAQSAAERHEPRLALETARALGDNGDCLGAQRVIERTLEAQWDPSLALLYGECEGGEVRERISRAEKWLEQHPADAGLLITLARLCMQSRLWGKAQSYLEASLSVQPTRRAHLALARLFEQLEQPAEADAHYRAGASMEE